jgi:dephospho-CoA kinase
MVRIGVTGLMGSGKSTVARHFESRGAVRIDGDALGWETLRESVVKETIRAAFGASAFGSDGEVDRERLGRTVFRDARAMDRLNSIVQPALEARVRAALAAARGDGVLVLDAALISTWSLEPELDGVVEVAAPVAERIRRLMQSRGLTEEAARERIRGQRLPPLRNARALWRIENVAGREELIRRADQVWEEIGRIEVRRG